MIQCWRQGPVAAVRSVVVIVSRNLATGESTERIEKTGLSEENVEIGTTEGIMAIDESTTTPRAGTMVIYTPVVLQRLPAHRLNREAHGGVEIGPGALSTRLPVEEMTNVMTDDDE